MQTEEAILLSYLKFGEYDAVAHFFTKENGYRSFFIRGLYARQNKKKPYLFPLAHLQLTYAQNPRGTLYILSKIAPLGSFELYQDVKAGSILFFMADVLHQIVKNEENAERYWEAMLIFLHQVSLKNYSAHLPFLLELLDLYGIAPLYSDGAYLDTEKGVFTDIASPHYTEESITTVLKHLLRAENPYDQRFLTAEKNRLLQVLMAYYAYHFPDFKLPASLAVVKEIFT